MPPQLPAGTVPWAEHLADLAALLSGCTRSDLRRLGPEVSGAVLASACRTPSSMADGGQMIIPAGSALTPAVIGLLDASGVREVHVISPVTVVVIPDQGVAGRACGAALRALGAKVAVLDAIAPSIRQISAGSIATIVDRPDGSDVLASTDLVVTIGLAGSGADRGALRRDGLVTAHVAMEPGGVQGIGVLDAGGRQVPWIDLPTDLVPALVACETLVRPALPGAPALRLRLPLHPDAPISSASGTRTFLAVRVLPSGRLRPMRTSGVVSPVALARADALAVIPEDTTEVRDGDLLDVSLLPARGVL